MPAIPENELTLSGFKQRVAKDKTLIRLNVHLPVFVSAWEYLFYLHIFCFSAKGFLSTSPSFLVFRLRLRQVKSRCRGQGCSLFVFLGFIIQISVAVTMELACIYS